MSQRTSTEPPAAPDSLPGLRGEQLSGLVLARSGPLAAGFAAVVGLLAAALVPFGGWRPWLVVPLALAGFAGVVWLVRWIPASTAPRWAAPAVLAIATGHGVWAALTHAEHVVLRRDAGSYALYTQWISTRHGLPIPSWLEAFGGSGALTEPAFRLSSPAYYQVVHGSAGAAGTTVDIVPQFLLGAPAVYSLGWWVNGWGGVLVMPAIFSALSLLGFAGLVTRLVGARWAVLATASLALAQPVLHAARSTYSEPIALLFVAVAAALLVDAVKAGNQLDDRHARLLGLAAGLTFGLAGLFRVDALREVSMLLPVAAVLALRKHPVSRPLVVGALGGTAVAVIPAVWLSRPYLGTIAGSLVPLIAGGVVLGLGSLAAVQIARRREGKTSALGQKLTSGVWPERWPWLLGGAVALLGVLLASRPLWMITRQDPNDPGSRVVAALQAVQGLTVDGGRTYAEHSLNWLSWYLGPVMLVAAWVTFTFLAAATGRWWLASMPNQRTGAVGSGGPGSAKPVSATATETADGEPATDRVPVPQSPGRSSIGRSGVPVWLGPAVVAFGSLVLSVYRPSITPDHPWADRRMVPVVIPALVIAAVVAMAWLSRRALRRWTATALTGVVAVAVVIMLLPPWLATQPVAGQRTEKGQVAAAEKVCAELPADAVVVALDNRAANEWPQVVRGFCDRPAASLRVVDIEDTQTVADSARPIVRRIAEAGNTPVLLAATEQGEAVIDALGLTSEQVVDLVSNEDQRYLTRVPDGEERLDIDVWLADASNVT
ncbi:hypothetical protein LWF15_05145 [Kineosporia rhizophila]|uniref:hypothetical protein n=1 Tax=Kineosporia TaxID=49184 RepID=UPI001E564850|nr:MULTISPECIES: hypothetical protein [Kineosporia]MCE0534887.1 hypothetical protein [Kineosporia rhizophila]GLY14833.1 hypothetical protein Kisp01_18480 [Kineosporia sp. NBRC 101677]